MAVPDPIVVIGAGAAGLMAAIFAAESGRPVVVLERTGDGGRKILISGGGRCNVLPSTLAPERFVTDSSPNTLRNLLRSWPLADQRHFFEATLGLPLVLEEDTGKLFPAANRSRVVRDALVARARALGVAFRFHVVVRDVRPGEAGRWTVHADNGDPIDAAAVVLATGGLSVPSTGSDGIGLDVARRLGHAIHDTYPALTPLVADPPAHEALAGVSLSVQLTAPGSHAGSAGPAANGSLDDMSPPTSGGTGGTSPDAAARTPRRARVEGRTLATRGGFLFTHRGYSGPAVLDLSHTAVRARLAGRAQPLLVEWTTMGDETWHALLKPSDGLVRTRLRQHLPDRLADWLARDAGVTPEQPLATLTRSVRLGLVERLCRYALPWTGDEGYRKAEVTGGGVALDEVHPRTLESRRHGGLFLCGELLDAFGPIGGHNFAWAWATGRLAGRAAARHAAERQVG